MTREDIIRMAREAGLHIATDVNWMPIIGLEYAEKFAELARADEREACAKVCDELAVPPHVTREDASIWDVGTIDCAEAIRARSNT